ncbi:kinase-like domain-containing protein [Mycena sanguinolenta]|nr:kinase-like domain-containing protein [Mycena sanguinolenta]
MSDDMEVEDQIPDATQTQEQYQPAPEPPQERPDPNLWGYLLREDGNTLVPEKRYDLRRDCPVVTIGRAANSTIHIPHPCNLHARITWHGVHAGLSRVDIEDLTSKNKTFVNGTQVAPDVRRRLRNDAEISFVQPMPPPPGDTTMQDFRFTFYDLASPVRAVLKEYALQEQLGVGSFGQVYRALNKKSEVFAVKDSSAWFRWRPEGTITTQETDVKREIGLMKTLDHPNVCRLVDEFWNADGSFDLVLEYMAGGDLFTLIEKHHGLSERMTKHLMRQLCEAVAFIHSNDIAHRDLKPQNILLTADRPPTLKIADFGLANRLISPEVRFKTICGTPMYLAPEFALHMKFALDPKIGRKKAPGYGTAVDCFASGVVCYECIVPTRPLKSDMLEGNFLVVPVTDDRTIDWKGLETHVISMDKEGYPVYFSPAGRDFVRRLMEKDPEQRLTMLGALQHEWFNPNDSDLYPLSTSIDTCDELTTSFQEVTVQTSEGQTAARNHTMPHSSQQELASDQVAPGLTRIKNKGPTMERQCDVSERAQLSQTLSEPSPEILPIVHLSFSTPGDACGQAEAEAEAGSSGGNKRKFSAFTLDTATSPNIPLRQGRTASPSPPPEPVTKKGKSVRPVEMIVSPAKNGRRR